MAADACDSRILDLLARWEDLRERGKTLTPEELCADAPELLPELRGRLRRLQRLDALLPAEFEAVPTGDAPGEPSPPRDIPGYDIQKVLGRGGIGVVYQARHGKLNRLVALKMLRAGAYPTPEELSRFRREAEAVAALQHPHIVQIFEVGEHGGLPYLALEYVPGGSLADRLNGTPLPPREAAQLLEVVARAVHVAHLRGIVHRDLKPGNILLGDDAAPKVADFGLAKRLDDVGQTQTGAVMGTPSYMAPEQAQGQTSRVGPATDVYALGAVLYECLTGRPPFKAESSMVTLQQVINNEPAWPRQLQPKVPRDLETICLKCLEKETHKRYPTAEALAEDLRRFLTGEPIRGRRAGVLEQGVKWARRRPALASLVFVVGVGVFGATAGTVWHSRQLGDALSQSEQREREAGVLLYASDMKVAHQFWQTGDVRRVRTLGERHISW